MLRSGLLFRVCWFTQEKYCILNKQYTKEEYEALKDSIISGMKTRGEYGKFPPYSLGLCPYNFSTASIYFPEVEKDYIESKGGYWEEEKNKKIDGMPTSDILDSVSDTDVSFSKQPLICPVTGWRFNIAPDELTFLKRKNIALPRVHFDVRTKARMALISQIEAYPYKCTYCSKDILAYYPKNWGYEHIACVECYQQNIN